MKYSLIPYNRNEKRKKKNTHPHHLQLSATCQLCARYGSRRWRGGISLSETELHNLVAYAHVLHCAERHEGVFQSYEVNEGTMPISQKRDFVNFPKLCENFLQLRCVRVGETANPEMARGNEIALLWPSIRSPSFQLFELKRRQSGECAAVPWLPLSESPHHTHTK